jgi:hypothetical protein
MAVTTLALAAAAAFATAIGSGLGSGVIDGFKELARRRFRGDRRAESALAAVERDPSDPRAGQVLGQALVYYRSATRTSGARWARRSTT